MQLTWLMLKNKDIFQYTTIKYLFWGEGMFLDSGNIISDETFCTQSQIMVEKFPNFRPPTATTSSWHPLTKAERFLPKIR